MNRGGVSTDENGTDYLPIFDQKGPLMFFPPHCVPLPEINIYGSPVIAYIKSKSQVQEQLVQQLKAFFENQNGIWQTIKSNKDFLKIIEEQRNIKKTPEQIQREKEAKLAVSKSNVFSGSHRQADQTFFPDINFTFREFDTYQELEQYIKHVDFGTTKHPGICFGFTVHEDKRKSDYELELFFNDAFVLEYRSLPTQSSPAINSYQMQPKVIDYAYYSYYGFGYLQNWVANTILRNEVRDNDATIAAMTVPMKIPPMLKDPFTFMLGIIAPYFFMLMYIPLLYRTTYRIVQEKELRVREIMRMMGMRELSYWLSWFLYLTVINTCIAISAFFFAGLWIFTYSSPTLVGLMFWLYGQSLFGMILFIQSFFTEARSAAVFATVLYFGSSAMFVVGENASASSKALVSLFPTICMSSMVKVILGFESNGHGVLWSNFERDYKNFSISTGMATMAASFCFWSLLGLYLENVLPRQFGRRQSPCFCLFCCKSGKKGRAKFCTEFSETESGQSDISGVERLKGRRGDTTNEMRPTSALPTDFSNEDLNATNTEFETKFMSKDAYEGVTPEIAKLELQNKFMKITNLQKQYDTGLLAVRGINLKLYVDQIFVMLGHNGAGKTSTISLLTGLYEPTQGSAEVFGINMFEDFHEVRQIMGVCPQHDVLFEMLTPQEHMDIFYDFKGANPNPKVKEAEITKLLIDVGVDDKKNDLAGQLSGGNQRKLSAAIALCGGSKFVVFDEPTAGMDLSARRQLWQMLKEYKKDRIILLTTHYMDEADILGDRIGIMTAGQLSCLGSSMFLKRKFGVGYNLTMLKTSSEFNTLVLPYFWYRLGKGVKKLSEIQSEVTLQIPREYSHMFKNFFSKFDSDLGRLNILAYGVSITTLEDVFMKVGHMDDPVNQLQDVEGDEDESPEPEVGSVSGTSSMQGNSKAHSRREAIFGTNLSQRFASQNFIKPNTTVNKYESLRAQIQQTQGMDFLDPKQPESQAKKRGSAQVNRTSMEQYMGATPNGMDPIQENLESMLEIQVGRKIQGTNSQYKHVNTDEDNYGSPTQHYDEQTNMEGQEYQQTFSLDDEYETKTTNKRSLPTIPRNFIQVKSTVNRNSNLLFSSQSNSTAEKKPNIRVPFEPEFRQSSIEKSSIKLLKNQMVPETTTSSKKTILPANNKKFLSPSAKRSNFEPNQIIDYSSIQQQKARVTRSTEATPPRKESIDTKHKNSKIVWNMQDNEVDDSFCNQASAVVKKRYLLYYNSKKYLFFDVVFPALLMAVGIGATKFSIYEKSPSEILGPERIGYNQSLILMDSEVVLSGSAKAVQKLASLMPNTTYNPLDSTYPYFDLRFTDRMSFEDFDKFIYEYGQEHAPVMPYFYCGYQVYECDLDKHQYKFYNFINMTNQDATGLYPQFMYEGILKLATGKEDLKFKVRNTPFPATKMIHERKSGTDAGTVTFISGVAYAMILTTICGQMVEERVSHLKHIQVISGVQLLAYWTANFLVDLVKMEFTTAVSCLTFYFSGVGYTEAPITYALFPFAAIPFAYVSAFVFPSVASAQTFMIFANFLLITVIPGVVFYLRWLKQFFAFADSFHTFLKIFPGYAMGATVYYDGLQTALVEFRQGPSGHGYRLTVNAWDLENIFGDNLALTCNFVFWTLLLFSIEMGLGKKIKSLWIDLNKGKLETFKQQSKSQIDEDVQEEARRIIDISDHELEIKVNNLRKVYLRGSGPCNPGKPLLAVENLSFGLSKGECFALLGVNGAGKSTTFKMLTSEEEPTSGSIKIQGMDMQKDFQKVRKLIGYCPQYNPIFDQLSVFQNIDYFASIKGIPSQYRTNLIEDSINELGLQMHRNKAAGTLSGGNKRKLSVAIAIVGNPSIILLDEPSAGMDPEARRFMWEVVGKIASQKTSAVILTSHLMEEAEALSTKMGIMVKGGTFKCFGSAQHIKNKFGIGFEIEIKIAIPAQEKLALMAKQELREMLREKNNLFIGMTLAHLLHKRTITRLIADKVRNELVITYKQTKNKINIEALETEHYDYERQLETGGRRKDVACQATVFMEKLWVVRGLYNTITAICKEFGNIDCLEQYGNYMRLRVSRQDRTVGQMFGMIDELKENFGIDQYSISQTTLEQIFQSFANLNFDAQVKTFSLDDEKTLTVS